MSIDKRENVEAFLFGFLAISPLYILQIIPEAERLSGGTGDLLLIPRALLIILGVATIGYLREINFLRLIISSLSGIGLSYIVFALLVGWSYVMFFIAFITSLPVILGAGISYLAKNQINT